jgi:CarboxypepD_reg-like domain
MRQLFKFIFLISSNCIAQNECIKTAIDSSTKQPIPFAIIQTENKSFYTDSLGRFTIITSENIKEIKIVCLGYETKVVKIGQNCKEKFFLKPKVFTLPEIVISSKPFKSKKIGHLGKSSTSTSQLDGDIIATLIRNESQTFKVIKKIILPCKSRLDKDKITSCFRIHLYSVGSNKNPQNDLIESNVVVCPKKTKEKIEVDISKFNFVIPKEGVFVGVEWIADENALMNKEGHKYANDIAIYIDAKSFEKYPSWEKRVAKNKEWKHLERPKGAFMSAFIGLEIEER